MANLAGQLNNDLKAALKGGRSFETGVLRLLISAVHNREIEKRSGGKTELSDEEVIEVLKKEFRKRKEAADLFVKGGRRDLADREISESEFIGKYLPPAMSAEEIEAAVDRAMAGLNPPAADSGDFGRAMAGVMKELKGRAEGSEVAEIIKKKLNG